MTTEQQDWLDDHGLGPKPRMAQGGIVNAVATRTIITNGAPSKSSAESSIRLLLAHLGEDPDRDGLHDTPARVVRALVEMTEGYRQDPADVLSTTFDTDVHYDQMVMSLGIPFTSLCEHHMLPFVGHVDIGYLPAGRVVGLSKLARLVDIYARRLQVQERMTQQIADAIREHLHPLGVGVVVHAHHSCQAARGIRKDGTMVTSAMHGEFRDGPVRAEFLAFAST